MKQLPEHILSLLALREGDSLSEAPLVDDPRPDEGRGQGFVLSQTSIPAEEQAAFWRENPESSPVPTPPGFPKGELRRSDTDPSLFWLEVEDAALLPLKNSFAGEWGALLLDSRRGPAGARVSGPGFELLVLAEQGRLRIFAIHRAPSALPPTPESAPITLEVPDLKDLLGEGPAQNGPGWLTEQAGRLITSPSLQERAAAVGLIGRLWTPGDPKELARSIEEVFEDKEGPIERATLWAKGLSPDTLQEIERTALTEVDALSEQLGGLHQQMAALGEGAPAARLLAEDILRRRDDLASVAFVLRAAGAGDRLDSALAGFDEEAETQLSLFAFLEDIEIDERLSAVSWQEPLAWWGALFGAD